MHKQPLLGEKPEEGLGSWLFEFSLEESDSLAPRFCFGVCFSRCVIKRISLYVQFSWNGKLQVHSLLAWLAFSQKLECAVGMGAGTKGKRATARRNQRKRRAELPGRSTEHHSYFWEVITEEGGRRGKDGLQKTHRNRKCNLPPPRFHVKKQMFRVPT